MNPTDEPKSYNALNLACFSNHELLKKNLQKSGSWTKAWRNFQNQNSDSASKIDADKEWLRMEKSGIKLLLQSDSEFPSRLTEIPWPPLGIYYRGAPVSPAEKIIAIVGTRKATTAGLNVAKKFAHELANAGLTIASGLALGIDAAAHASVVGLPSRTISVLAHGLDSIYPKTNVALGQKILDTGGALISEYPIGSPSLPQRFIERNRIISGLSIGIIVIEAPENSGALATARFALDQNREIFVVPGPIDNPNYFGAHGLIKAGANLITSVQDIFDALGISSANPALNGATHLDAARLAKLDEIEKTVILALKTMSRPASIDDLTETTRLETKTANATLSLLLIKELIKEENGKYYL